MKNLIREIIVVLFLLSLTFAQNYSYKQTNKELDQNLIISPRDTIVETNSEIEFDLFYKTNSGVVDTTADKWEMKGVDLGSISNEGILTIDTTGFALIKAELEDKVQLGLVIAQQKTNDETINQIEIAVPSPLGYETITTFEEGKKWVIGDLPQPMNIYNGAMLYFPIGSLDENIQIRVNIPDFANIEQEAVSFGRKDLVSAIVFDVYVNGNQQEHYEFEMPLLVGMVYQDEMLEQLDLDPQSLRLIYTEYQKDSIHYSTDGIEKSTNNYYQNSVFAKISHLSVLGIRGVESTSISEAYNTILQEFKLHQNYPNPFNPTTTIKYGLPEVSDVKITIYNINGKPVETLVNSSKHPGYHKVKWNASDVASGVYFYRIATDEFVEVKKCVLLK